MRYYLPLREKSVPGKRRAPSRMLPLWVWLLAIDRLPAAHRAGPALKRECIVQIAHHMENRFVGKWRFPIGKTDWQAPIGFSLL